MKRGDESTERRATVPVSSSRERNDRNDRNESGNSRERIGGRTINQLLQRALEDAANPGYAIIALFNNSTGLITIKNYGLLLSCQLL